MLLSTISYLKFLRGKNPHYLDNLDSDPIKKTVDGFLRPVKNKMAAPRVSRDESEIKMGPTSLKTCRSSKYSSEATSKR